MISLVCASKVWALQPLPQNQHFMNTDPINEYIAITLTEGSCRIFCAFQQLIATRCRNWSFVVSIAANQKYQTTKELVTSLPRISFFVFKHRSNKKSSRKYFWTQTKVDQDNWATLMKISSAFVPLQQTTMMTTAIATPKTMTRAETPMTMTRATPPTTTTTTTTATTKTTAAATTTT